MRRLGALVIALLIATGCGGHPSATGRWILDGTGPDDAGDPFLSLGIDPTGMFTLHDKCNTQQGSWRISGRDVDFTNVSMTMALCPARPDVIGFVTSGRLVDNDHLAVKASGGTFTLDRDDKPRQ